MLSRHVLGVKQSLSPHLLNYILNTLERQNQ